ncbi:hypothetical protein NDU88_000059 [Pleurodeles waltl]|uniref:Uncharacterized protein n=1 Tax=Pleurodeles waltl TaxID=8319 RepID=A0AAV7KLG3_PLEWA|nr:hypothetical protein NDU88_000059 [Pleurodeles waltl]
MPQVRVMCIDLDGTYRYATNATWVESGGTLHVRWMCKDLYESLEVHRRLGFTQLESYLLETPDYGMQANSASKKKLLLGI